MRRQGLAQVVPAGSLSCLYQRIHLDELGIGRVECAPPRIDFCLDLPPPLTAVPPSQRVFFWIAQPFKDNELFPSYARQPELTFRNSHRLLAQQRIFVAIADRIHQLLDLTRQHGIVAAKYSKPVPAAHAARAHIDGAGAPAAALAAVDSVNRDLFRGSHCPPSLGPAIDSSPSLVSRNSPSIMLLVT